MLSSELSRIKLGTALLYLCAADRALDVGIVGLSSVGLLSSNNYLISKRRKSRVIAIDLSISGRDRCTEYMRFPRAP
jgi:hypothetical protein